MTDLVEVDKEQIDTLSKKIELCRALEEGNILFFPKIPFSFPNEDLSFLLEQKQTGKKKSKNIAFKPSLDKISNHLGETEEERKRLHEVMRRFSQGATLFLQDILAPYTSKWRLDYASFRPFQEKGRKLRITARNDLLHFDAFPSRPMHGDRILRFFININPSESRKWITASSFKEAFETFWDKKEIFFPKGSHHFSVKWKERVKRLCKKMGLPVTIRSPYDTFMLQFHHFLKRNKKFQQEGEKKSWEFPPFSCWAVFTDQVSHAALEGQYALEQTFLIPREALLNPEKAPISILESFSKEVMTSSYAAYQK